jgi:hypothetical protein
MPATVSSRVLRHERVSSVRLTPWGGMAKGVSEAHRNAAGGRGKVVALPFSASSCCLRTGGGRTGAVGRINLAHDTRQGTVMLLSRYQQSLCVRSTLA